MDIPDFSKPSKDCFLSVDKNGTEIKTGDVLESEAFPLHGTEKVKRRLAPVENWDGNLVIPHFGSFLLDYFVQGYCEIKPE